MLRWRLDDGVTSYTFAFNPNQMTSPYASVPVRAFSTTDGVVLLQQVRFEPTLLQFSGVIQVQGQYDALLAWMAKTTPVALFDHLGRSMSVFIKSFAPVTVRSRNAWKHQYEMSVLVLTEPVDVV